ncbi:MAG: response regulator [Geodermatophilaceae bacterium]
MTIRVVVVDDQEMVRAGIAALLDGHDAIEVVGQAADGASALRVTAEVHPDVVLMDIRMPGMDGLTATRRLLAGGADAPRVLVLTTFDADQYVFDALRAGASGFLLKGARPADLVDAVRVVAAGDALLAPSVTRRLVEHFAGSGPPLVAASCTPELTPREREVLVLIARGLSNTQIAAALVLAEQTVKTHVSHVLTKLGLRDRAQAVVHAYETGVVTAGRG